MYSFFLKNKTKTTTKTRYFRTSLLRRNTVTVTMLDMAPDNLLKEEVGPDDPQRLLLT